MNIDYVVVKDTLTGEVTDLRRTLFESPVFNPDGLFVETKDTRSGCVSCGIEPSYVEPDEFLEDETEDDEENED